MPVYVISEPPSVNSLYFNLKNGGRAKTPKYNAWLASETKALKAQKCRPIEGRAVVKLTVPNNPRRDIDSYLKAACDLLVKAGVLVDDKFKYLASVSATFGDVQMCRVSVEPEAA